MPVERQLTREEVYRLYSPIDYNRLKKWGDGSHVIEELSHDARRIYDELKPYQDQRDDPGHADIVIHFSLALSRLLRLSQVEVEAVALAAIFHDSQWATIPDINKTWNRLATQLRSGNTQESAPARDEMARLRRIHEERAAELVLKMLPQHPFREQIASAVRDHDTRAHLPEPIFRAFYDGDWLWRETMPSRYAGSSGNYSRDDAQIVFGRLQLESSPYDFTLPWAYHIARLERANTLLAMQRQQGWQELPGDFLANYEQELTVLRTAPK